MQVLLVDAKYKKITLDVEKPFFGNQFFNLHSVFVSFVYIILHFYYLDKYLFYLY